MKKKLLSLALSLTLCCCLTLSACAVGTGGTVAPDNAETTVGNFVASGNEAGNSVDKFANSAGDTTVTDASGNTYTLSNPILYTISEEQIKQIPFADNYVEIVYDGEESLDPKDSIMNDIKMAYAVPIGTVVTAPTDFEFSGFNVAEIKEINGNYTAVCECYEPPYLGELELDYRELGWFNTFWVIPCDYAPEGQDGNQGRYVGDIVFFTPEDSAKPNPFGSSSSTAPTAPEASQTPAVPAAPTTPADIGNSAFTDVAADAYYAESVKWAVKKGITSGTTATTFSPNNTCTTAQILTFLWRAKGSPEPTSTTNPFTDVNESAYYYKAALWAKENNVLPLPFNPSFRGDAPCTRGMAMLYIWKAAGSLSAEESSGFADVGDTTLYAPAVDWAVEKGVTSGTTATTFSPDNTCTRAQIVTFLYRAFK